LPRTSTGNANRGGLLAAGRDACLCAGPGPAEDSAGQIPDHRQARGNAEKLVPKGWLLQTKAIGDLNGDSVPDAAHGPSDEQPEELGLAAVGARRPASTAIRECSSSPSAPRRVSTSRSPITCSSRGSRTANQEQPFDGIKIENGLLKLKMHLFFDAGGYRVGRWGFAFRWQGNGFKAGQLRP
jgi:hypothetical protein